MKKLLVILILLFSTSSCRWFSGAKLPYLAFTNIQVPNGTPKFQKGYRDGCATALYSRGYGLYRDRYDYALDAKMIDDSEYMFGRRRGYTYCFTYAVGAAGGKHFGGGWDNYIYNYGAPLDMNKASIDDNIIGKGSGTYGGKANSWDTWGDDAGGVGGFMGIFGRNRANSGGVMGGHAFYGTPQNHVLSW